MKLCEFLNIFSLGMACASLLILILSFISEDKNIKEGVNSGHAHYDERTGELVWNSGNCR